MPGTKVKSGTRTSGKSSRLKGSKSKGTKDKTKSGKKHRNSGQNSAPLKKNSSQNTLNGIDKMLRSTPKSQVKQNHMEKPAQYNTSESSSIRSSVDSYSSQKDVQIIPDHESFNKLRDMSRDSEKVQIIRNSSKDYIQEEKNESTLPTKVEVILQSQTPEIQPTPTPNLNHPPNLTITSTEIISAESKSSSSYNNGLLSISSLTPMEIHNEQHGQNEFGLGTSIRRHIYPSQNYIDSTNCAIVNTGIEYKYSGSTTSSSDGTSSASSIQTPIWKDGFQEPNDSRTESNNLTMQPDLSLQSLHSYPTTQGPQPLHNVTKNMQHNQTYFGSDYTIPSPTNHFFSQNTQSTDHISTLKKNSSKDDVAMSKDYIQTSNFIKKDVDEGGDSDSDFSSDSRDSNLPRVIQHPFGSPQKQSHNSGFSGARHSNVSQHSVYNSQSSHSSRKSSSSNHYGTPSPLGQQSSNFYLPTFNLLDSTPLPNFFSSVPFCTIDQSRQLPLLLSRKLHILAQYDYNTDTWNDLTKPPRKRRKILTNHGKKETVLSVLCRKEVMSHEEKLYFISSLRKTSMLEYDFSTNRWKKFKFVGLSKELRKKGTFLQGHTIVYDEISDQAFLFGGFEKRLYDKERNSSDANTNSLYKVSFKNRTYEEINVAQRDEFGITLAPLLRSHHSACIWTPTESFVNEYLKDGGMNIFTQSDSNSKISHDRTSSAFDVPNTSGHRYMVIFGGESLSGILLKDVWLLELKTFQWRRIETGPCSISRGAKGHKACCVNDKMIVACTQVMSTNFERENPESNMIISMHQFDFRTKNWTYIDLSTSISAQLLCGLFCIPFETLKYPNPSYIIVTESGLHILSQGSKREASKKTQRKIRNVSLLSTAISQDFKDSQDCDNSTKSLTDSNHNWKPCDHSAATKFTSSSTSNYLTGLTDSSNASLTSMSLESNINSSNFGSEITSSVASNNKSTSPNLSSNQVVIENLNPGIAKFLYNFQEKERTMSQHLDQWDGGMMARPALKRKSSRFLLNGGDGRTYTVEIMGDDGSPSAQDTEQKTDQLKDFGIGFGFNDNSEITAPPLKIQFSIDPQSKTGKGMIFETDAGIFFYHDIKITEHGITSVRNSMRLSMRKSYRDSTLQTLLEREEYNRQIDFDDLEEIRQLGFGASSKVYLVQHRETGQEYAMKVMGCEEDFQPMLIISEIKAFFRCRESPYIVTFHQAYYIEQEIHMLLEYMNGGSLADILTYSGMMPEHVLGSIAVRVLKGLVHLHRKRIIHRDIKPENILFNKKGSVKIGDFGLIGYKDSRMSIRHSFESETTHFDTPKGTYVYMSPERFEGRKYSYNSDVWSFGMVLIKLRTGQLPFETSGSYWKLVQEMKSIRNIKLDSGKFSNELRNLIYRCIIYDPHSRPSSEELLNDAWIQKFDQLSNEGNERILAKWIQQRGA